ncbi:MAG: molybdopterin molybdotransferase MoeA, partial [Verrucomicrobia bacterium]|nr:molybdopterin molybdotransferase MoeA [Verrucomicrobiota bacterium]
QPAFDRSSVDGYAIRLDDPGSEFGVVAEIRAGEWKPGPLQPGQAVRIATGGALPCEGLQVVMKEDAKITGTSLTVLNRRSEKNIRFRGEEARQGQVLLEVGTELHHGALGLLASLGHTQPLVSELPRVLHLTTGNELVSPDQTPGPGQIRDSNSTLVRAFLRERKITPEQLHLPEDEAGAQALVEKAEVQGVPCADLLLVSGGASVGEHDFTRRLLERLGYTVVISQTKARPGKPLIVAHREHTLAFGLPGNPLAHFVCLNLYVRAALDVLVGCPPRTCFDQGVLEVDFDGGGNSRETFWPAYGHLVEGVASLTPLRWSSSSDLTSLARANALLRVKATCQKLPQGARVEFVPTARFL